MPVVQFDWDDIEDNIDEEFDEHGNSIVEYTTEPGYHGNVESQFRDGVTSTFHHDGLGSTIAVTNDAGEVTDTLAYSAFGSVTHRTGTTEFPFQFVGQKGYYLDTATGDHLIRRRPYRPTIARWLSVDPSDSQFGYNQYLYCKNTPLAYTDSSGLSCDAKGCESDETRISITGVNLVKRVIEYELGANVDMVGENEEGAVLILKSTKVEMADRDLRVLVVFEREIWTVICCKDKTGSMRVIEEKKIELTGKTKDKPNVNSVLSVARPHGPPTRSNMKSFVDFAYPIPFWKAAEKGDSGDCLAKRGPKSFGPRLILEKTVIDKKKNGTDGK